MPNMLWGENSRFRYLFLAAFLLLFAMLGSHELWTQEHRWADIVFGMFYRHDFLHPYLGSNDYYDKPLFSYWLMAAITFLTGEFSLWALRIPSALAGLLAIWSIYRIGLHFQNKQFGLLSGWLLLTTFYFVFWARTSSADMLNLAGTLFAVSWYIEKKESPGFWNFAIFFLILAVTALCKGLVGPVVTALAILPDLLVKNNWKKYLRVSLFFSFIPAAIIYFLPFWASTHIGGDSFGQSGLYLVYRENILRYFQPFDHKDPIYTYFIYLPIYLFPWVFFFFPAIFLIKSRWKDMSWNSKWMVFSTFLLFLFFTLSGSRRSYYVLPIVPFAILMTADWIQTGMLNKAKRYTLAGKMTMTFFIILVMNFVVLQPLYYGQGNMESFAYNLKLNAEKKLPWDQWQIVLLDPETKLNFYLKLSPQIKNYGVTGERDIQTEQTLLNAWPMLKKPDANMIFITRASYEPIVKKILFNYNEVQADPRWNEIFLKKRDPNAPIAFIPK